MAHLTDLVPGDMFRLKNNVNIRPARGYGKSDFRLMLGVYRRGNITTYMFVMSDSSEILTITRSIFDSSNSYVDCYDIIARGGSS